MKIKITAVLMCIVLGLILIGCASAPSNVPNADGAAITNTETGKTEEPPFETVTSDAPETPTPSDENSEQTSATPQPPENTPTEPPEAVAKTDTLLKCTASSLNVRAGAGTSYDVLGTLDKGDMVMPIHKNDGWYEIWYLGGSAYASASYLTEVSFDTASDRIEQVITEGKKLLGIPYVYGAQRYHFGNGSLNSKFDGKSYDCSSLMQYIFKIGADVNLAMTSREQSLQGKEIARADIRRGDLLFFTNASRLDKTGLERIGHVALYLGDNMILHTASDHAVIEAISSTRSSYYITARRFID